MVVGGTLAVGSVAYGLGTQADDGTAVAEGDGARRGPDVMLARCAPPDVSGLADELGVNAGELRRAFRDFHEERMGERPRVFRALPPDPPRPFERHDEELAKFLADRFDLEVDRVSDALAEMGPPLSSPHRRGLPDHPPAL